MLLVFMLSPVALVSGQPRSDRSRDRLFGPVQTVVETYSQSECGPGRYGGSVAITSYDREGYETTEAYDPSFCYSPVIHYRHDPDGSVHSYQDGNRCGDMPVQIPLYKILRGYDSSTNTLKEEYYHGGVLVSRIVYVYDRKGRPAKKRTFQAAEPVTGESRFTGPASDKFKPIAMEEVYKYGTGAFPDRVTFIRDGKALWSYSYEYVLDPKGNWTQRIAVQHPGTVQVPTLKTVTCRELTYWTPGVTPAGVAGFSQTPVDQPKIPQAPPLGITDQLDQLACGHYDPMCYIRAAQSLAERGEQLDLALACVQRAMAIPHIPNDAVPRQGFFLTLAYVQIRRGEFDQAITTLTKGAEAAPEYSRLEQYLTYLGLAYENTGRIDEAIETYISLAGGLKEISDKPNERLLTLYRKRFGSLEGLNEKIEANRLKARKKLFVESQLLSIPAPDWSLQDLNGRHVSLSDFSNEVLVLSFVGAGGNAYEPTLKFLQAQYEKYKDKGVAFVCIDSAEKPDTQTIKINLERMGVTIPTLIDYSEVARRYKTIEPLIVLIDQRGTIRFKNSIWHDYRPFVTEQIEFLLQSQAK